MIKKTIVLIGLILNFTFINAQTLDKKSLNYLNRKVSSINVDENYNNGDWEPVLRQLKNKRIVLLGEFNHGSKEIFIIRNDLIKNLHQNLGFNVILFESGIGELITIDLRKKELSPTQMTFGFFGNWRTKEFSDLMKFVKSNNISVSGFDVQRTGGSFEKLLKIESEKFDIDSKDYLKIEERFGIQKRKITNRKAIYDSLKLSTINLITDYQNLLLLFKNAQGQNIEKSTLFIERTILNRITYLEYFLQFLKNKDWNKRWKARDSMMASNIEWLMDTIYKNEKVIVIAHNFHISKFNEKEEVMGEFLKKKYRSEMYSIGVFGGKGTYLGNYGNEEELLPAENEKLDIKYIINELNDKVNFLNIPKKSNKKNSWIFNKIIINDTFIDLSGSNELILSKHFDGLLLIDRISTPEKE